MTCYLIPHFNNRVFNKYLLEKCMSFCCSQQARLYSATNNHHERSSVNKIKRKVTKKTLESRILQDIKHTKARVEEIIERENIWTIPNFLCVGRIVTSPFLGYFILSQEYQVALCLLGIAGVSDLADGWIARTWSSQASKLGSFLDPAADKLLIGTLFLSLTWVGLIPVPLTLLVIIRDIALVAGASYIRYLSLPSPKTLSRYFDPTHATVQLAPTFISKMNTGMQLTFVAAALAAPVFDYVNHPILQGLCYLTAITTIAGGFSYLLFNDTYKILTKRKIKTKS